MKTYNNMTAGNQSIKCVSCNIREFVLFSDLSQEDFSYLHFAIKRYDLEVGETLYSEADEPEYVYTICSGLIKLAHYLPSGDYKIARLLHRGDLAGIESLAGSHYLQHAITLKKTTVCRIAVAEIEHLNHKSAHLYKQLMIRWQRAYKDADIWLSQFTVGSSRKRVACLLIYLTEESAEDDFYLPTREDIGALVSISATTASRIIAEFKRQGLLQSHGLKMCINKSRLGQIT
jgi:CRP-like cAMP-binding protein